MAEKKITETEVSDEILETSYVLVTQPVKMDDGAVVESLRRIPLSIFNATVEQLAKDVADLEYVPIDITTISNTIGTVELGSVVIATTVNWGLNKEPVSQRVNGEEVDVVARSKTLDGLSLTQNTDFTVEVTDERGATDSSITRICFYNGVYYGVLENGTDLDSAAILCLTRKLQGGKGVTFTVDAGASQRIAYALPTNGYGTPNFNVGGFDGGFSKAATIDFKNASGHTESYDVWLSDNTGLGSTTVKVS